MLKLTRANAKGSQIFFFDIQLWPLISLQPLDQYQCLVIHLKDLFHLCWGTKAQGIWMTFNVWNFGSKYPYFNRAYVILGVCILFVMAVEIELSSLSEKIKQEWSGSFLPGTRIDGPGLRIPEHFLKFQKIYV